MTPDERTRLARAMTAATGEKWRVAGKASDPAVEGVVREDGRPPGFYRVGPYGYLVNSIGLRLWIGPTPNNRGRYVGRGWMDRFVRDAVAALARYTPPPVRRAVPSARDTRRAITYRALLRPDSGASESERMQARKHLQEMER